MSGDIFDILEDAVKDIEVEVEPESRELIDNFYVSSRRYPETYNDFSVMADQNCTIGLTSDTASRDDVLDSWISHRYFDWDREPAPTVPPSYRYQYFVW